MINSSGYTLFVSNKVFISILLTLIFFSCASNSDIQSSDKANVSELLIDFDPDTTGYDTPEEIALGVIEFLKFTDTVEYLKLSVPLQIQKYLYQENFELLRST